MEQSCLNMWILTGQISICVNNVVIHVLFSLMWLQDTTSVSGNNACALFYFILFRTLFTLFIYNLLFYVHSLIHYCPHFDLFCLSKVIVYTDYLSNSIK